MMTTAVLPRALVWRRLHSLTGLWIVLFLIEHLLTNSQAALLIGEDGQGFVRMVDWLHNLPYLQAIEIFLLGVPIAVHMVWGVQYALAAKQNSFRRNDHAPHLPEYGRNKAYSWQRITSWILLVALILHVVKFRFLEYPVSAHGPSGTSYFVRIHMDDGLYTVAERLGVTLYDASAVATAQPPRPVVVAEHVKSKGGPSTEMRQKQEEAWLHGLQTRSIHGNEVIAESSNFGTATLLSVRDTFKSPLYAALYTVFVLAAAFHGFNGFWTFLITWGLILNRNSHTRMVTVCTGLMFVVAFLGLASIWGTYWLNLRV